MHTRPGRREGREERKRLMRRKRLWDFSQKDTERQCREREREV